MTYDFGGWECRRAAECGGFVQPEIVDATAADWRRVRDEQRAHLGWHAARVAAGVERVYRIGSAPVTEGRAS